VILVSGRKANDRLSLQRLDLANHYLAVPAPQSRSVGTYSPPSRVNNPANLGLRTPTRAPLRVQHCHFNHVQLLLYRTTDAPSSLIQFFIYIDIFSLLDILLFANNYIPLFDFPQPRLFESSDSGRTYACLHNLPANLVI
jgi:hypothetical protein